MNGKTVDITEEIPFGIPNGWEWARLSSVASIFNGDRGKNYPSKSTLTAKGIPFVSALNIDKGNILKEKLLCMTQTQFNALRAGKFIRNDILLCIRGSLGKYAVAKNMTGAIASSLAILRCYQNTSTTKIVCMWLESQLFSKEMDKYDNGTAQPNLAAFDLSKFFIPFPPLAEQQRIVTQIAHLMAEVDKIDQEAQELDRALSLAKQKVLDLAIRGKLVPQDPKDEPASELLKRIKIEKEALIKAGKIKRDKHESFIFRGDDNRYYEDDGKKQIDITPIIPFDLPDNWLWVRLRNIGEIVGGGTPSTTDNTYWKNGNIAWLSPADLTGYSQMYISHGKKNITELGLQNSSAVVMPAGSLLYSSRAPIGYIAIAAGEIATNQGFKSVVPTIVEINEFYYYALKAITPDIKKRATGTTFKEISGAEFGATLVPLPPLAEQKRIVSQIERVFAQLETMQK